MMKTIVLIFLWNIVHLVSINAQKCYVCDQSGCDRPGQGDIKSCSDADVGGTSGKTFVHGALAKQNASTYVYNAIEDQLNNYAESVIGLNKTTRPSWKSVTQWVCYKTVDKRRGCLAMGKGLCSDGKSWLKPATDFSNKIATIMNKARNAVTTMFEGTVTASLSTDQKGNITNWFAENYLSKLVNNSNDPQFQLEYCCDGDACNFASMVQKSTAVLILLFLLTLIVV